MIRIEKIVIKEFRGITETASGWRIGALTTWTEIVRSDLPPAFRSLQQAGREIGSIQIQNRGTIGGNICNASPAADGVPPLLTLNARVEISSQSGRRELPLQAFIKGVRSVDLNPGEIVSAIHVPQCADDLKSTFHKLGSRTHMVISIAMVAAAIALRDGRIAEARVAVGSCSPVARRLPDFEVRLSGMTPEQVATLEIVANPDLSPLSPITDVRGSASYRLDVVSELCRRAVLAACEGN